MTNDFIAGILAGITVPIIGLIIFQIGLNIGVRNVLDLLNHEYPAAYKSVNKNKKSLNFLPYVIASNGDQE